MDINVVVVVVVVFQVVNGKCTDVLFY